MQKNKLKLILASASPRRKELLAWSFLPFEVIISHVEENTDSKDPTDIVVELASLKAISVAEKLDPNNLVIGADTIVVSDGEILGKPSSRDDARNMLNSLSGKSHEVYTGVCFVLGERKHQFFSKTIVNFDPIDSDLLEFYLQTGESLDKAGSYGIQGAALGFISELSGSYSNVVGLPINQLIRELCDFLSVDYKGLNEIFN